MASANQQKSTEETKQFVPSFECIAESLQRLSTEQLELFHETMHEPYMQTVRNLQKYMFSSPKQGTFEAAHANGQVALMNALFKVISAEVNARKKK